MKQGLPEGGSSLGILIEKWCFIQICMKEHFAIFSIFLPVTANSSSSLMLVQANPANLRACFASELDEGIENCTYAWLWRRSWRICTIWMRHASALMNYASHEQQLGCPIPYGVTRNAKQYHPNDVECLDSTLDVGLGIHIDESQKLDVVGVFL